MIQTKGVFVGASSSGGGAASSIVIGNPVTGGGVNRVLYEDASQNLAASALLTYSDTQVNSGPGLTIGSSGTSVGMTIGYRGLSGYAAIWNSALATKNNTTYAISQDNAGQTLLNSASGQDMIFAINGGSKATLSATAGSGVLVIAGTAATNAPRALSISQGWTDGTTGNIGIVANFDMGATGTATGKLLSLQAGAAGTTEVASINQAGDTLINGFLNAANYFLSGSGLIFLRSASANIAFGAADDASVSRVAAGIVGIGTGTAGSGAGALFFSERTAPSAPAANGVYIYAQDNGAGKTQLMALFNSGAAQQIAIEP